jgi:hypothetical protein
MPPKKQRRVDDPSTADTSLSKRKQQQKHLEPSAAAPGPGADDNDDADDSDAVSDTVVVCDGVCDLGEIFGFRPKNSETF